MYLYNKPHCLKAVRLDSVAASSLGYQNGHSWAPQISEGHNIGVLATLLQIHLQQCLATQQAKVHIY